MAKPPHPTDEIRYVPCPYCTIAIPSRSTECPHCRQRLSPPAAEAGAARPASAPPGPLPARVAGAWARQRRLVLAGVPVLLALAALALVYNKWVGVKLTILPGPGLPIAAEKEKKGDSVVVRGTVTNEGDDIPDLSLKSIGLVVELVYRDGRRRKQTVFPKNEYRGEGALLKGETGRFEVEAPRAGLAEIVLRTEIVDLGTNRELVPPGGRWRIVGEGR